MKSKTKLTYILLFIFFLTVEIIIALFVRDSFIRPYVGDMLVTVVLCLFIRGFTPVKTKLLPLLVFFFAAAVEICQYFDLVALLGLETNRFISVLIGRTFSMADIICYATGCILFYVAEGFLIKKKQPVQ